MEKIAERIGRVLEEAGLPRKEFAARIGIAPGYLSEILSGKKRPSDKLSRLIASEFGVDERWIKGEIGEAVLVLSTPGSGKSRHLLDMAQKIYNADEFVSVPRYRIEASAGGGAVVESEQIVDYLKFSREWLSNALGLNPNHLALISVIGDSMSPTYNDGDLILVDTTSGNPKSDAVYVLQHEGHLWVKRLNFRLDGTIHVISDNPRYPEQIISGEALDRLNIVGRVMWRGGR